MQRLVLFLLLTVGLQPTLIPGWNLTRTVNLKGRTHHVQGVEFDSHTLWVTSVDSDSRKGSLQKFALDSGALLKSIELQDQERFHPGGIAADGDAVWVPLAEYRANSTSVIQKRDKDTLELIFQFHVADHIGCLAVTPEYLIGGNWDSRNFYLWDRKGNLIRKTTSETNNAYQDIKFEPPY